MYYLIEDTGLYLYIGLFGICAFIAWFNLWYNREYFLATFNKRFRGMEMILKTDPFGGFAHWGNVRADNDWLKGFIGNYEKKSSPVLAETPFYLLSGDFGLTVDPSIVRHINNLRAYGFFDLESALKAFDSFYLNLYKEDWERIESLEKSKGDKGNISAALDMFLSRGREDLLNLVFKAPAAVDLAVVFNAWTVQTASAQNNKVNNDADNLRIEKKYVNEKKGIMSTEKFIQYVIAAVILLAGIVLVYNMLPHEVAAPVVNQIISSTTSSTLP